ncbi:MAG: hypothetical protein A2283_22945 [Lentisphaerae bacterium RIFOXYA12_FULL_48_11]|nr:MAG: hypothetical protein A2283_22945 [Lentisphaerae bacterium RIFOXYA12_FULL_48_11]
MKDKEKQIIGKIRQVVKEELAGKIPDLKQWFKVEEAASIFAVSSDTIRNWMDAGTLEARMINCKRNKTLRKHVRVTRESIVKLLNDRSRQAL